LFIYLKTDYVLTVHCIPEIDYTDRLGNIITSRFTCDTNTMQVLLKVSSVWFDV